MEQIVRLNDAERIILNDDDRYEYQFMVIDKQTKTEHWISIIESITSEEAFVEFALCKLESITDTWNRNEIKTIPVLIKYLNDYIFGPLNIYVEQTTGRKLDLKYGGE